MSELKVASCFEFEKVLSGKSNKLFYAKSEVDEVIAEKDAKILALDAEVAKQKHHAKLFFDERNYAETQLHRQKYKRCLAMADMNWWQANRYSAAEMVERIRWNFEEARQCSKLEEKYLKRYHKWLELAEEPTWAKFLQLIHKEAK